MPGSLSQVNNNPGNLRYVGQAGATGSYKGYATFSTPDAGWSALERQLQLDARSGDTLAKFVSEYAPPVENDTGSYLRYLVNGLGVPATTPLTTILGQQTARVSPPPQPSGYDYGDGGVSADFGAAYTEAGILGDLGQIPAWAWLGLVAGAAVLVMVKGRD